MATGPNAQKQNKRPLNLSRFQSAPVLHVKRAQGQESSQKPTKFSRVVMERLTDHYCCVYCGDFLRATRSAGDGDFWHVYCREHADRPYFIARRTREWHKQQAHEEWFAVRSAVNLHKIEPLYKPPSKTKPFDEKEALKDLGF